MMTLSPSWSSVSPSTVSRATVRRIQMTGEAHRTISSTPVAAIVAGSCTQSDRWSGCWVSASSPWLMALRVVSFPATTSRMKKDATSLSVSASPSTFVLTRAEVMSSVGWSLRNRARSSMSRLSCCAAVMNASIGSAPSGTYSVSPLERMTLEAWNTVS